MDYLSSTCLERFTRAVRAGYRDFVAGEGYGYGQFDEEERWDEKLYFQEAKELFWLDIRFCFSYATDNKTTENTAKKLDSGYKGGKV